MKYLFALLLISAVTLAHGQSTEIGLRGGASYNFSFRGGSSQQNYFAVNNSLYIYFPEKRRISYELSLDHYQNQISQTYRRTFFDVPYPFYDQVDEEHLINRYFDVSITFLYDLHKEVPFQHKKFQNYIGFSAGLLLNTGKNNIKYTYPDTSLVEYATMGAGRPITSIIGFCYYSTYELSGHITINALLSFKISGNLIDPESWSSPYAIYYEPDSYMSLQFGMGYRFHVKRNTNDL